MAGRDLGKLMLTAVFIFDVVGNRSSAKCKGHQGDRGAWWRMDGTVGRI